MAGPIRINIIADGSAAQRAFAQTSQSAGRMTSSLAGVGRKVAAGLAVGGAAAAAFGASAVKSASDAQQSLGATQTVFGKYADTVIKRSNEAAQALGLSANEYRELSNVTGALLSGAGVPLKQVSTLTADLNKKAADMAATFGGTTRDAVEAVSSLLKGEADPIERYGVSIKQSDVSARLAAKGLDNLTGAGLKTAEMQARLELLNEKTAKTNGAFARESGTLANQQQKLAAQFENVKAKIGTALLPVLTRLAGFVNAKVLPAVSEFASAAGDRLRPIIAKLGEAFASVRAKLEPVGEFFRKNPELIKGAAIGLGVAAVAALALAAAMGLVSLAASPIVLVAVAAAAVGAAVFLAYKRSETFRNVIAEVGAFVTGTVVPALQRFGTYVTGTVVPAVVRLAQAVAARLKPILTQLAATFRERIVPTIAKVVAKFRELQPTIARIISVAARLIGGFVRMAATVAGRVIPVVIRLAGFIVSRVVPAIANIIGIIIRVVAKLVEFGAAFVKQQKKVAEFVGKVVSKIAEVIREVASLPGKAATALSGIGTALVNAGRELINGLLSGITEKFQDLRNKMSEVANVIGGFLPGSPVKTGPLKAWNDGRGGVTKAGRTLVEGLALGIDRAGPGLDRSLSRMAGRIAATRTDLAANVDLVPSFAGARGAVDGGTRRPAPAPFVLHLTADAVSDLERGRRLTTAIDAAGGRGLRRRAVGA